jgi:hypothetical protein
MRRFVLPVVLVLGFAASARAQTLTVSDILELTKAGLNEQALLALVEVHKSIFPIDRDTLKMLKASGVSDNVIVAMIRSGRDTIPPPPPAPLLPSLIVDRGDGTQPLVVKDRDDRPIDTRVVVVEQPSPRREERRVREVEERVREVAVPVYVPVPTRQRDRDERPDPPKAAAPVYWGFDGKLRPDAWKPGGGETKK